MAPPAAGFKFRSPSPGKPLPTRISKFSIGPWPYGGKQTLRIKGLDGYGETSLCYNDLS